jgi:hypothetical protein
VVHFLIDAFKTAVVVQGIGKLSFKSESVGSLCLLCRLMRRKLVPRPLQYVACHPRPLNASHCFQNFDVCGDQRTYVDDPSGFRRVLMSEII